MSFEESLRRISSDAGFEPTRQSPLGQQSSFSDSLLRIRNNQPALSQSSYSQSALSQPPTTSRDVGLLSGISRGLQRGYYSTAAGMNLIGGVDETDRYDISRYNQLLRSEELAPSESYSKFVQSKSFGEAWNRFWEAPIQIMAELIAESLVPSAGAMAGAGAGMLVGGPVGAAVGVGLAGAASGYVEYANEYLNTLAESGIDMTDPEQLVTAFEDEELLGRARERGVKKGIPVGIFDAASVGLAGRIVTPARKAFMARRSVSNAARYVGASVGETLGQGVMGGAGEAAGQIAVEGRITEPGAVAAEFVGELGPGAFETLAGTVRQSGYTPRTGMIPDQTSEELTRDDRGLLDDTQARQQVVGTEQVGQEARQPLYGEEGEGTTPRSRGEQILYQRAPEEQAADEPLAGQPLAGQQIIGTPPQGATQEGVTQEAAYQPPKPGETVNTMETGRRRAMAKMVRDPADPTRNKLQRNISDMIGDHATLYAKANPAGARTLIERMETGDRLESLGTVVYTNREDIDQTKRGVVFEINSRDVNGIWVTKETGATPTEPQRKWLGNRYRIDSSLIGAVRAITGTTQQQLATLRKSRVLENRFDFDNVIETEDGWRVERRTRERQVETPVTQPEAAQAEQAVQAEQGIRTVSTVDEAADALAKLYVVEPEQQEAARTIFRRLTDAAVKRGTVTSPDEFVKKYVRYARRGMSPDEAREMQVLYQKENLLSNRKFTNWYRNSKVNKNGYPVLCFHGTAAEIISFDASKAIDAWGGRGVAYFTEMVEEAEYYSKDAAERRNRWNKEISKNKKKHLEDIIKALGETKSTVPIIDKHFEYHIFDLIDSIAQYDIAGDVIKADDGIIYALNAQQKRMINLDLLVTLDRYVKMMEEYGLPLKARDRVMLEDMRVERDGLSFTISDDNMNYLLEHYSDLGPDHVRSVVQDFLLYTNYVYATINELLSSKERRANEFRPLMQSISDALSYYRLAPREGEQIYPVYLSIQNPFEQWNKDHYHQLIDYVADDIGKDADTLKRDADAILDKYLNKKDPLGAYVEITQLLGRDPTIPRLMPDDKPVDFTDEVKALGFDGFVHYTEAGTNYMPRYDKKSKSHEEIPKIWVPFEPTQVKSMLNVGTWSKTDPDIFHQGEKGAISFDANGGAVFYALKSPNFSTFLHETGHFIRRNLLTPEELSAVESEYGVVNGEWTIEAEERFAEGHETYWATGEAPNSTLKAVFEKVKAWLAGIYANIKDSPIARDLPDGMRRVFDAVYDVETAGVQAERGVQEEIPIAETPPAETPPAERPSAIEPSPIVEPTEEYGTPLYGATEAGATEAAETEPIGPPMEAPMPEPTERITTEQPTFEQPTSELPLSEQPLHNFTPDIVAETTDEGGGGATGNIIEYANASGEGEKNAGRTQSGRHWWNMYWDGIEFDKIHTAMGDIFHGTKSKIVGNNDVRLGVGVTGRMEVSRNVHQAVKRLLTNISAIFDKLESNETRYNAMRYLSALSIMDRYVKEGLKPNYDIETVANTIEKFKSPEFDELAETYWRTWNDGLREIAEQYPYAKDMLSDITNNFSTKYIPNKLESYMTQLDPEVRNTHDPDGRIKKLVGGGEGDTVHPATVMEPILHMLGTLIEQQQVVGQMLADRKEMQALAKEYLGDKAKDMTPAGIADAIMPKVMERLGWDGKHLYTRESIRDQVIFLVGGDTQVGNQYTTLSYYQRKPKQGKGKQAEGDQSNAGWDAIRVPKSMYEGIKLIQKAAVPQNVVTKFVANVNQVSRMGIVGLSLDFLSRNPVRDFLVGFIQHPSDITMREWTKQWFESIALLATKPDGTDHHGSEALQIFRKMTGLESTKIKQNQVLEYVGFDVQFDVSGSIKGKAARKASTGRGFLRKYADILAITESVTRVAGIVLYADKQLKAGKYDYIAGIDKGGYVGQNGVYDSNGNKIMSYSEFWDNLTLDDQGALTVVGQRLTTDFHNMGYYTRNANNYVMFFGPAMGGLREGINAARRNPTRAVKLGLMFVTLPTLIAWWANKDEDWYRDQPDTHRYLNWQVKLPGTDTIVRIPRPFEWGAAFGTVIEGIVDGAYQRDPKRTMEAVKAAIEVMAPIDIIGDDWTSVAAGVFADLTGTSGRLILEQYANRQLFGGRPIVPEGERYLRPEEQRGPYTTSMGKTFGAAFGVSPRRVDHFLRTIAGRTPFEAEKIIRQAMSLATTGELSGGFSNVPGVAPFIQRGGTGGVSSESVDRVYKTMSELESYQASSEVALTPDQEQYLRKLRATTNHLSLLRGEMNAATSEQERSRIGNRMRTEAMKALEGEPSLEPITAPETKRLVKQINSMTQRTRSVILNRKRDELRQRMPNISDDRLGQYVQRSSPELNRISHLAARARIADRTGDAARLREILEELNGIMRGL